MSLPLKISLLPDSSKKKEFAPNINIPPNQLVKNSISPQKKIPENSLSKCSSEKVLSPFHNINQENVSPRSPLKRANSAVQQKRTLNKQSSQDDSLLNYNENPLDYIFKLQNLKKSESEKNNNVKEFEDIPSPGEKIKKPKTPELVNRNNMRRLSNSLAVSISPKAKESNLSSSFSFSMNPQNLNESVDSALKKYKVVMIKSMSCILILSLIIYKLFKAWKKLPQRI